MLFLLMPTAYETGRFLGVIMISVQWSNGYDFCLTLECAQKVPSSILG